jgi:hypothetical protein
MIKKTTVDSFGTFCNSEQIVPHKKLLQYVCRAMPVTLTKTPGQPRTIPLLLY